MYYPPELCIIAEGHGFLKSVKVKRKNKNKRGCLQSFGKFGCVGCEFNKIGGVDEVEVFSVQLDPQAFFDRK